MTYKMKLILYGSACSREKARSVLENLPCVRQVIPDAQNAEIILMLNELLQENSLIPLLAPCVLSGVRLVES